MKKTIQLTLLLITLLSFSSIKAFAYDVAVTNEDGKIIYYNYSSDGKELSVTKGNSKYSGKVVVPAEVMVEGKRKKVTSIGERAFYCCSNLTFVTIPNTVTTIGEYAFGNCI